MAHEQLHPYLECVLVDGGKHIDQPMVIVNPREIGTVDTHLDQAFVAQRNVLFVHDHPPQIGHFPRLIVIAIMWVDEDEPVVMDTLIHVNPWLRLALAEHLIDWR